MDSNHYFLLIVNWTAIQTRSSLLGVYTLNNFQFTQYRRLDILLQQNTSY